MDRDATSPFVIQVTAWVLRPNAVLGLVRRSSPIALSAGSHDAMMLGDLLHPTTRDVESLGYMFYQELARSVSPYYRCVPYMISVSHKLGSLFTLLYCEIM